MRHLFHFCWHKAREWLGDLFFIGLFIIVFGVAPEKWVESRLEWFGRLFPPLDLVTLAKRLWPEGLDVRMAPITLGSILIAGSVIWRQLSRRRESPAPQATRPQAAAESPAHSSINPAQVRVEGERERRSEGPQPRPGERGGRYDVFLSHSGSDAVWVEKLAKRLRDEQRFKVWLDRWVLVPGRSWQRQMAAGLEKAICCAVCINSSAPDGWARQELERALDLQATNENYRVIPILLPDCSSDYVPDFLSLRTWADFRLGMDHDYAFHVLSQGIRGRPVGPWSPAPSLPDQTSLSVYERRILALQRFRSLGVYEEVEKEFQRKVLSEWFEGGDHPNGT